MATLVYTTDTRDAAKLAVARLLAAPRVEAERKRKERLREEGICLACLKGTCDA